MPEVEYTTIIQLPPDEIWDFVKDMGNWAPFLTGYQKHEVVSETDSIWTLKGDVGILSRVVQLKAHITEWSGPEKVSFTLTGLNENVDGGGTLFMGLHSPETPKVKKPKVGVFRRMMNAMFRFFFVLFNGKGVQREKIEIDASRPASQLKFVLRMEAAGPSAPLVNAMLGPALLPAAEDLANKIAGHLEKKYQTGA